MHDEYKLTRATEIFKYLYRYKDIPVETEVKTQLCIILFAYDVLYSVPKVRHKILRFRKIEFP